MSEINAEQFPGFSENHYQHGMHSLAWISLWLIVGLGVLIWRVWQDGRRVR